MYVSSASAQLSILAWHDRLRARIFEFLVLDAFIVTTAPTVIIPPSRAVLAKIQAPAQFSLLFHRNLYGNTPQLQQLGLCRRILPGAVTRPVAELPHDDVAVCCLASLPRYVLGQGF